MPDCTYCQETFDGEEAYLAHLRETHEAELSRIDRRRVRQAMEDDGGSRLVVYGAAAVVVVLLAAAVYVTVLSDDGESTPIESRALPDSGDSALLQRAEQFPSQGNVHVASDTQIDYSTSPPTSGPHYNRPASAGFYTEQIPAGNIVHSLEHGAIVVYYDPAAMTPAEEESLRAFVRNHDDPWASVIAVPNPNAEPESSYVLTAWRTMLRMDEYDPEVVRAFMAEYIGRGPENPVR